MSSTDVLPEDAESLKRLLLARETELPTLRAKASEDDALIAHLRLQIEKFRRQQFGQRSERGSRLLDAPQGPAPHTASDLADGAGGGATHRRPVRHRA